MKKAALVVLMAVFPVAAMAALPLVGMYQTIDDVSGAAKSVVALYEYHDGDDTELAGRIVALYGADGKIAETIANPSRVATKVKGAPKYAGLDIIWGLEWDADDNRFEDGKIMDPTSGRVYSSLIWADGADKINVRGRLGPVGRTQKWRRMGADALPAELKNIDTSNWTPNTRK